MAVGIWVNVSGYWKEITGDAAKNVSAVWKTLSGGWRNLSGLWKQFYLAGPPDPGWTGRLHPDADLVTTNWSNTPLYQKIDEDAWSDADYVYSIIAPDYPYKTSYWFRVRLENPGSPDPNESNGVEIRCRTQLVVPLGTATYTAYCRLEEGGVYIAQANLASTGSTSWRAFNFSLTVLQKQSITNWDNLDLKIGVTLKPAAGSELVRGRCSFAQLSIT